MCWNRSEPSCWSTRKCASRPTASATCSSGSSTIGARMLSGTWPPRTAAWRSSDRSRAGSVSMVAVTTASIDSGHVGEGTGDRGVDQLLQEQGVAAAALDEVVDDTRRQHRGAGRGDGQLREVVPVQRCQVAAHHRRALWQLEPSGDGTPGHQHRPRAPGDLREQRLQELAGRGVEPVGVLDGDEGRLRQDPTHQVDHRLLERRLAGRRSRAVRSRGCPAGRGRGARRGAGATAPGGVRRWRRRRRGRRPPRQQGSRASCPSRLAGRAGARSTAWPGCSGRLRRRSRPTRGRAPTSRPRASTCRCQARRRAR